MSVDPRIPTMPGRSTSGFQGGEKGGLALDETCCSLRLVLEFRCVRKVKVGLITAL